MDRVLPFLLFPLLALCSSCTTLDENPVGVSVIAPESAQVAPVNIAYDSSFPKYTLKVAPVVVGHADSITYGKERTSSGQRRESIDVSYTLYSPSRQPQITAQLTTALMGVGNFELAISTSKKAMSPGARGPFVVQARITEFTELAEQDSSSLNLLTLFGKKEDLRKGVVGLDIAVTESGSERIVVSFPVQGTFISRSEETSQGFVFQVAHQQNFTQSAVDQALRVAINDAAAKLFQELSTKVR